MLNKDCILTRYYPLIPYKNILTEAFKAMGCKFKSDCLELSDETLLYAGLPTIEMANLFKRFLMMYDVNPKKLREIDIVSKTTEEAEAFKQLYHLPGVKSTRATLYYKSGFTSLDAIACSSPEEIMKKNRRADSERKHESESPLNEGNQDTHSSSKSFYKSFSGLTAPRVSGF
ncbi:MAG: hypothetical protein ACI4IW_05625 [Oscillospiraceae bacterium]